MSKILSRGCEPSIEDIVWHHATVSGHVSKRKEGIHLQFTILLCPRTETCPDGNHQMGIVLMNILPTISSGLFVRVLPVPLHLLLSVKTLGRLGRPPYFI